MKKNIRFSKFFTCAVVVSAAVIIAGIVSVAVRGINFGLDFKPGMIEEVRIAPAVMEVTYTGSATVSVDPSAAGLDVVVSGVGAENRTVSVPYAQYGTVAAVAEQLRSVEGVSVKVLKDVELEADSLYVNSAVSTNLSENPLCLFAPDADSVVNADAVREALKDFESVDVKTLGTGAATSYQIRMGVSADSTGKSMQEATGTALANAFGADKVAVVKSDFIGSQFSKNLVRDSILLVLATLVLIWIYATIRFHWDFALASVIAVIHDSLVMIAFITFTQVEFSTTTIAAILTIVGYSINATVVILDRVRSDMKIVDTANFKDILNLALNETFSRSVITTVTTLFSVVALFVFTTGTIHDFAQVLIVGLLSGCYSSIFITGAFIAATRKNFKNEGAVSVKASGNVFAFES
ncbi:MAG: protein translocase subunit SecF [Treponema sp.]|nr:protein translocase subunit SecF [Treponema sp.]